MGKGTDMMIAPEELQAIIREGGISQWVIRECKTCSFLMPFDFTNATPLAAMNCRCVQFDDAERATTWDYIAQVFNALPPDEQDKQLTAIRRGPPRGAF